VLDLTGRLGLPDPSVVANLIFRLATKVVLPKDFIETLKAERGFGAEKAKAVAQVIKERVFAPVDHALQAWGVTLSFIDTSGAPALDDILKKENEWLKSIGIEPESVPVFASEKEVRVAPSGVPEFAHSVSVHSVAPLAARPPFVGKSTPPTSASGGVGAPTGASGQKIENQPKPLILHEERSSPSLPSGPSAFPQPKKHFSVLNFLKPKAPSQEVTVKARIEIPGAPAAKNSLVSGGDAPKRVVYYSDTRTSVSPTGAPGGTVNLDTLRVTQKSAQPAIPAQQPPTPGILKPQAPTPSVSAPLQPAPFAPVAPRPVTPPPPQTPKLDGNTIDLRQNNQPQNPSS